MKNMWSFLTKTLGIVTFTMPLAFTAAADMTMRNIQIQNCTPKGDFCISVKAPKAEVSSVRPIYFMKNVEVELTGPQNALEKKQNSQGYLDFDSNQLVLQSIDKKTNTLTEEIYNLTTMQKQVFVTR